MRRFQSFDDFELQVLQTALAEFQSATRSSFPGDEARATHRREKAAAGGLFQEARGEQRQRRAALAAGLGEGEPAAGLAGADGRRPSDG
jgi:hypothetical protein